MGEHSSGGATWRQNATQVGLSFLRVLLATTAACWIDAGAPIREIVLANVIDWVELGAQAGAALIFANYIGPWERRYGLNARRDVASS